MTWPTTRIRDYNDTDPVNPNDLNLIQDAVIAGAHGAQTMVVTPGGFVPRNVGGEFPPVNVGTALSWPGGGTGYAHAWVPVPVGHRVLHVEFVYDRGGAGTMQFDVLKISGATSIAIGNTGAIAAGTGETTVDIPDIDYIVEDGYGVQLVATGDNAANQSYTAIVYFDYPPA